jgi:hypothetical protein
VAPTKVLIVPLSAKEEFDLLIQEVCTLLCCLSKEVQSHCCHLRSVAAKFRKAGVFSRIDDSKNLPRSVSDTLATMNWAHPLA